MSFGPIIPLSTPPRSDVDRTTVVESYDAQRMGELDFDRVVKAIEARTPEVVRFIEGLKGLIWAMAEQIAFDHGGMHPLVVRAKDVLRPTIEVEDEGFDFHAEIPPLEPE